MFYIIGTMFLGILLGYLLKGVDKLQKISKLISYTIFLLLFLLGISVGANREIVNNLPTLGVQAFILATAGVFGSIVFGKLIYTLFFKRDAYNGDVNKNREAK